MDPGAWLGRRARQRSGVEVSDLVDALRELPAVRGALVAVVVQGVVQVRAARVGELAAQRLDLEAVSDGLKVTHRFPPLSVLRVCTTAVGAAGESHPRRWNPARADRGREAVGVVVQLQLNHAWASGRGWTPRRIGE
jgi:hypothetical protein